MSSREQLNYYIRDLERRLRLGAMLRGAAVLLLAALCTTIALVLIINLFAFSEGSLLGARGILALALSLIAIRRGLRACDSFVAAQSARALRERPKQNSRNSSSA